MNILIDYAQGKFDIKKYEMMSQEELEKEIKKIIAENKGVPENALIGKVMAKLRGKAEGSNIVETIKKISKT